MHRLSRIFDNDWDNSEAASSIGFYNFPPEYRLRKKIKYSNASKAIDAIFREYCNNSSVHGVRYLGEEKRPIWEKIFWIFLFVFSFTVSVFNIINIYIKWQQNPVIVSFSEKSTPVWNIPFPAITICLETKTNQKIFNFTDVYTKLWMNRFANGTCNLDSESVTDDELSNFLAMLQICSVDIAKQFKFPDRTFEKYLNVSEFTERIEDFELNPNISLAFCKYTSKYGMCESFNLTKVYSDEGICYKFNGLKNSDIYRENSYQYVYESNAYDNVNLKWNLEDGYTKEKNIYNVNDNYPKRTLGAGSRAGLFMVLQDFDYNVDNLCRGFTRGFKVLLHSPDDAAVILKHYLRVPLAKEVMVSVIPNIITTSEGLRHYSPQKRQCYFTNERNLTFFKIYSQTNCELECLTEYTLKKCRCVKFSMPRFVDTPVCNIDRLDCVDQAEDEYLFQEFLEGLQESREFYRGETKCNCLPSCTSLTYDAEISQNSYNYKKLLEAYEDEHLTEFPGIMMSRLSIFFKLNQYQTSKRSELYGYTDFAASCGGLLALFMGVSALSLVEIIYYCTVRLLSNIYMRKHSQEVLQEIVRRKSMDATAALNAQPVQ